MNVTNDGGPAFAHAGAPNPDTQRGPAWASEPQTGMTLRDWFAGQALNAFIISERDPNVTDWDSSFWASHAYRTADAMLAKRNAPSPPRTPPSTKPASRTARKERHELQSR